VRDFSMPGSAWAELRDIGAAHARRDAADDPRRLP
jgi:hypothetical protein